MAHNSAEEKAKSVFHAAWSIKDSAQREVYLEAACAGDHPLRVRIDSLLSAADDEGEFLESPLDSKREDLFRELFLLDCASRRRDGHAPSAESWTNRFPEYADLVGTLIKEMASTPNDQPSPAPDKKSPERPTDSARMMGHGLHIRCPHCHQPIEIIDEDLASDVTCSACDSNQDLIDALDKTESNGGFEFPYSRGFRVVML